MGAYDDILNQSQTGTYDDILASGKQEKPKKKGSTVQDIVGGLAQSGIGYADLIVLSDDVTSIAPAAIPKRPALAGGLIKCTGLPPSGWATSGHPLLRRVDESAEAAQGAPETAGDVCQSGEVPIEGLDPEIEVEPDPEGDAKGPGQGD